MYGHKKHPITLKVKISFGENLCGSVAKTFYVWPQKTQNNTAVKKLFL
jgi:hypothetical protein